MSRSKTTIRKSNLVFLPARGERASSKSAEQCRIEQHPPDTSQSTGRNQLMREYICEVRELAMRMDAIAKMTESACKGCQR